MRRFLSLLLLPVLVASAASVVLFHAVPRADAAGFDANTLISDAFFTYQGSMSVAEIQTFLAKKGSVLATIGSDQLGADAAGRSAAQIIYDAAHVSRTDFAHGAGYGPSNPLLLDLNPQVILIVLQKEQSLITGSYVSGTPTTVNALNTAMGYGCPDSGGCNQVYSGFTDQVTYGAAQLMYGYYKAGISSYIPGQTYTIANTTGAPYNAPATQQVTIGNSSTSSLYQYTPHVYNGNYNFWFYLGNWFGLTANGNIPKVVRGSGPAVYYYQPNPDRLMYVSSYSALPAWNINMVPQVVDDATLSALPVVGTISQVAVGDNGYAYVILYGMKYHISSPQLLSAFGLSWSQLSYAPSSELANIPEGAPMGFMVSSTTSPDLYLATNNQKFYFNNADTVFNWGFDFSNIQQIDPALLANVPTSTNPMQTFYRIQNSPNMYAVSGGKSMYIPNPTVAYAWGFDPGNASQLGTEMATLLPQGPTLSQVVMNSSNGDVFYMSNGTKRYVSSYSKLTSVGKSKNDVVQVSSHLLAGIPDGPKL